jgi:hypothetical protein
MLQRKHRWPAAEELLEALQQLPEHTGSHLVSAGCVRLKQGGEHLLLTSLRLVPVILTLALAACGRNEAVKVSVAPVSPKPVAVSNATLDAEITEALTPTTIERESGLEARAEEVLSKHPKLNAADLLNVPEVNASLKVALTRLGEDKALQNKINSTVALAAQMKGLSGEPGAARLDLDVTKSEDPKRIVSFLAEEIGEAAPELAFGGADRARNGIAIKEQTPPVKPAGAPPD